GFFSWAENVDKLRLFANNRVPTVRNHFVEAFDEITGTGNVAVNANPANGGTIFYSTLTLEEDNLPFSGVYFRGIDIPARAKANRGYIFNNWSGASNSSNATTAINISGNASLTANFGLGSTATSPIVINEINYNSPDSPDPADWIELHNPNNFPVDISGWYFEDESDDFFGLPANTILPAGGYLVLVEEAASFTAAYPSVSNFVGEFGQDPGGFGLSGGGERITLKNANGVLIDAVEYDDKDPWPTAADGDGPTLQLSNPSLDNALAGSWTAIPATPGALNGTTTTPTPQNQTISFTPIANQTTTAAPFSLNATASSGLPVSFTLISGPATLSGNVITLTGSTGTVTVRASQAGNINFNAAPNVNRSFNVTSSGPTGCDCTVLALTPDMITNLSNNSNVYVVNQGGSLVDEQSEAGDPICEEGSTSPTQEWILPWGPQSAYIDLGAVYEINTIALLDGSGIGDFEIFEGTPGNWGNKVVSYNTAQYLQWEKFENLNLTTRYLRFDKTASEAKIREIKICVNSGVSPAEDQTISFANIPDQTATNSPFQLTATASSGLPVSFEILAGPAAIFGNTLSLTGGTGTVVVRATQAGNADFNAAPPITRNFNVTTGQTAEEYCEASGVFPWHEWISSVNLANLNHTSSKSSYSDFTNQSADLVIGNTYTLSLTTGFSYTTYDEYFKVWIDYNQNNIFEEPQELAFSGILPKPINGTPSATISDFVTVPNTASAGTTRMRVAMQREAYADPCGEFPIGEVEDYTINLSGVNARLAAEMIADLSLYPNPVEREVALDFELKENAAVKTIVANAQGVELFHTDTELSKGTNQLTLDVKDLPAGFYLIYLKVDGFAPKSKSFLKVRDQYFKTTS
ncbi:MAG: lamin tail domain-containing protein, partial [Saprospiraceae bacterium]